MLGVEDFDVRRGLDLAGGDGAGAGRLQRHALGAFGVHAQGELLDVEDDVDDVLADAFERRELVDHAVDLDRGDGGALQRGEQDPAQRVAEGDAEAALEGLGDDTGLAGAVGAGFDHRLFGADQFIPITFDHGRVSLGDRGRAARRARPRWSLDVATV